MKDLVKASNRRAIIILIGVCFMQAGGLGAILDAAGVFFVPVCEDLGFARAEIAFYLTCYLLGTIVAMPFVGNWISRFNINILLTIMFTLVVIAVGLMGSYNEPWQWWISGVVFGTAGSFIFGTGISFSYALKHNIVWRICLDYDFTRTRYDYLYQSFSLVDEANDFLRTGMEREEPVTMVKKEGSFKRSLHQITPSFGICFSF